MKVESPSDFNGPNRLEKMQKARRELGIAGFVHKEVKGSSMKTDQTGFVQQSHTALAAAKVVQGPIELTVTFVRGARCSR
jgi:hypothetical protein